MLGSTEGAFIDQYKDRCESPTFLPVVLPCPHEGGSQGRVYGAEPFRLGDRSPPDPMVCFLVQPPFAPFDQDRIRFLRLNSQ